MGNRGIGLAVAGAVGGLLSVVALSTGATACDANNVFDCTLPTSPPSTGSSLPLPPLPTTTTTQPRPKADPNVVAARLFELVNQERTSRGIPALTRRADVDRIAKAHGDRMAAAYTIWHNDDYFTAATKRLIGASFVGENVAKNSDIDDMHRRLMNSPDHRENILDRRFSQVGIGVGVAPNGELFGTEDFLTPLAAAAPAPAPAAPKPAPAPSTTTTTTAAPEPVAEPDPPVELAMPGPVDMVGGPDPLPSKDGGGGRSAGFVLLCLAALATISAPLVVGFSRYHHA